MGMVDYPQMNIKIKEPPRNPILESVYELGGTRLIKGFEQVGSSSNKL
jgi:hypothetical protein